MIPDNSCTVIDGVFSLNYKIVSLITILLFSLCLIKLLKDNYKNSLAYNKVLSIYCSLIILFNVSILIDIRPVELHLTISHIIKLATLFPIFHLVTELAFKKPLEVFFSDLREKNSSLAKKEELLKRQNKELIIKNQALIKANLERSKSDRKYKQLLHFLPQAVLLIKGTTVSFINESFIQLFDIKIKENIINKDVFNIIPGDLKELFKKQLSSLYSGNDMSNLQTSLNFNDRKIDLEYSLFHHIINNEDYILVIFEDITENKQAQDILTSARVEEENEQLKIGFLANISHELRTPISLIYSAIQVQEQCIDSGDMKQHQRYTKVIKQNCFRLLRIINNLIDATRIDASYLRQI